MPRKTRRAVLAATGVTLLAGCSSSDDTGDDSQNNVGGGDTDTEEPTPTPQPDSDNDGVPDVEDDLPNDPEFSVEEKQINDNRNIPEDEWIYWEYELDGSTEIEYEFTVRDGPEIDVLLVTEEEYEHLEERERYRYITEGSVLDSGGGGTTVMPSEGNYRLIFDNSSLGEASPPTNMNDDIARVEIEVWARA